MPLKGMHEGEHVQDGWYRFWALNAWRSWLERRREWRVYSRAVRGMRSQLLSLDRRARTAQSDRALAERNIRWTAELRPGPLPVQLEPGELGLGVVGGVELRERKRRRRWALVDRGDVFLTDRRIIFSGTEVVSFRLADVTNDSVGERGWELSLSNRRPAMLAGPVERLVVLVDAVVDGVGGTDPGDRWWAFHQEADHRLREVAQARSALRHQYTGMQRPRRPVGPAWVPAGVVAIVVLIGSLASSEPPPPTVLSVQITTTTSTNGPETSADGVPTASIVVSSTMTPACHTSYRGTCVPVGVVDVDCRGGSDDGPYYVGEVTVIGPDVYGLDPDGDGVGCE